MPVGYPEDGHGGVHNHVKYDLKDYKNEIIRTKDMLPKRKAVRAKK